jgi:photosystem II stability/assembly factor-like uncharacterized protein
LTTIQPAPELGYDRLTWRQVGPSRGGRCVAVAGDRSDPSTFWMGACAGGIWKTTDAGIFWRPVGDGQLGSSSVGAIAVADSDPNVVWVGMGEACVRNNVVQGDGVYRTTDAGRSWDHLGLEATRHISRVRVDPDDPDVAYVGALGDIFGPNPERGVYRTRDGGQSWELVLHVSERAGCADLAIDARNPRILYAAIWEAVRRPWEMVSGGPDSGLWRSTDGGDTWEPLHQRPGFPAALLGRIGVAPSPARDGRVWALVEAGNEEGGVYRSDDHGTTWDQVSDHRGVQGRPWYYSHIIAHPTDADTVWSMNLWAWRSDDAGRSWSQVQTPHGDNHDLWIDPADPRRMINGNDGGACVSTNAGGTWSTIYNQPTAQIYRFDVDPRFPHDLYATQQDNSGIRVPSRSWKGAIRWPDCQELGEAESGDVALDPIDPRYVFVGGAGFGHPGPLLRFDTVTEQAQDVAVWPEYFMGIGATEHRHRFGWTYPISFSPHDPSTLYVGGECVFRSTDRGREWEAISPDLTRNDPDKQGTSGGPISKDTSGAEVYDTIHALAESPLTPGELWVGTDDGLVHLSQDGGASWSDVTPPQLPAWATVQRLEPSRHAPGTVYLAAHAYRIQDRRPLLLRSRDRGATWETIVEGIPDGEWTRTVREDPTRAGLLYAGTEHRPWASLDDGDHWFSIAANLPDVPIYDLQVRDHELIAGTHGRGFWILDDVTPLRELPTELESDELRLFSLPLTYRYPTPNGFDMPGEGVWVGGFPGVPLGGAAFTPERQPDGTTQNVVIDGGTNPPNGVAIRYVLGGELARDHGADARVRVLDGEGRELVAFAATPPDDGRERPDHELVAHAPGLNRFVWDLRIDGPVSPPDDQGIRHTVVPGPRVPPGRYTVELEVGPHRLTRDLTVVRDPRLFSDDEDLQAQYDLLLRVRDRLEAIERGVERATVAVVALERVLVLPDLSDELREVAVDLVRRIDAERRVLANPDMQGHGDALKFPAGLDQQIVLLPEIVVELSDTRPTASTERVFASLEERARTSLDTVDELLRDELQAFERRLADDGVSLLGVRLDGPSIDVSATDVAATDV